MIGAHAWDLPAICDEAPLDQDSVPVLSAAPVVVVAMSMAIAVVVMMVA